ncbi:MAG: protease modulator HflC [Planctomycetes bacterium]|nr:protease modulator HflC [Planctomycetota bacterium]
MKTKSTLILGLLIVAVLLLYMVTYQVRFDQSAVVTTFGRAAAGSSKNVDGTGAGLYWKWPWPIQRVRKFDRRIQVLDDRFEQQDTLDKQTVIVKAYAAWRISDPLEFYRCLRNSEIAGRFLRDRLRTARAEIGNFNFDDLTNVDPSKLKLAEVEQAILERMHKDLEGRPCGIEVSTVGITRILLPEQITRSVFQRMRQTRQRLAQKARSEGEAIARSVRAKAQSDEQRIRAFADRRAQEIRAEGDAAAAEYYSVFAQNEDFAVFLRKLEALRTTLATNTTFFLDADVVPFDMLKPEAGPANPPARPAPALPESQR